MLLFWRRKAETGLRQLPQAHTFVPDLDLRRTGPVLFAERASADVDIPPTPSGFNTATTSEGQPVFPRICPVRLTLLPRIPAGNSCGKVKLMAQTLTYSTRLSTLPPCKRILAGRHVMSNPKRSSSMICSAPLGSRTGPRRPARSRIIEYGHPHECVYAILLRTLARGGNVQNLVEYVIWRNPNRPTTGHLKTLSPRVPFMSE
jgi:hypothetical protein